jgi:sugar phosphate isomerase/epimerase
MERRDFLKTAAAPLAALAAAPAFPMGYNTYCLRALRWTDAQHLDYAASLKLDALFLQDSLDPKAMDPAHWAEVKAWAAERKLHLESGGGGILPKTDDAFNESVATLRKNIERAKGLGSPLVRCVIASERSALPPGPAEKHMATVVRLLKTVKPQVVDAGVKIAIEVHKDFQAWEFQQIVEEAGRDFVGIYLDTGNPVFSLEDPLAVVTTLAPYALTLHLRDSVVYEHPRGIAVQWVPLGEGVVDFKAVLAKAQELCPRVHVYIKPITGRPPFVHAYLEPEFWKLWPEAKAPDLARFIKLAKQGKAYEGHVVIEDLPGRPVPPHFAEAVKFQQKEHMERSIAYAKNVLGLGVKWRG